MSSSATRRTPTGQDGLHTAKQAYSACSNQVAWALVGHPRGGGRLTLTLARGRRLHGGFSKLVNSGSRIGKHRQWRCSRGDQHGPLNSACLTHAMQAAAPRANGLAPRITVSLPLQRARCRLESQATGDGAVSLQRALGLDRTPSAVQWTPSTQEQHLYFGQVSRDHIAVLQRQLWPAWRCAHITRT